MGGWVDVWMDGYMGRWMDGDGCMDEWMCGEIGWLDWWVGGCVDGWRDGWMGMCGWIDGMDEDGRRCMRMVSIHSPLIHSSSQFQ